LTAAFTRERSSISAASRCGRDDGAALARSPLGFRAGAGGGSGAIGVALLEGSATTAGQAASGARGTVTGAGFATGGGVSLVRTSCIA
jgi:hypothetical protein